jgi:hypothetical protein
MPEMTISVLPVEGGWAVQPEGGEASLFLSGGRAEAHAQRLGRAAWRNGAPALVVVHNRRGEQVGVWRFGPGAAGVLERAD